MSPSRTKSGRAYQPLPTLKVPLLWCNPLCAQASVWVCPHQPGESGGKGNWHKCVMLMPLAVPWVVTQLCSEPVDLGLLPASMKLTVYLGSLQGDWILRLFTVLNSFINKDRMLTVTWLSGRMMRRLCFLTGVEGSPGELAVNMLTKWYGQPGSNSPLLCYLLMKSSGRWLL